MQPQPCVIIVDDELAVGSLVAEIADWVGFETLVVTSARDFLQCAEERSPDLIVMDVVMPDMDGVELIQHIATDCPEALLIIVSGYQGRYLYIAERMAKAYHLPLLATLAKPFELDELERQLQAAHGRITGKSVDA